ncbi:MAG: hypothetical protein AAF696_04520 [Bacteroidota bacterium]
MKSYLLRLRLIFILGLSLPYVAQAKVASFKHGFYVNQNQDSVRGYVKLMSRELLQQSCVFKKSKDAQEELMKPQDILAYGFEGGKVYQVRNAAEEGEKWVFMELLQSGRLHLFRYDDRFFLEYGEPLTFAELKSTEKSYNEGYRVYREEQHEYAKVLAEAMADCPNIALPLESGRKRLLMRERDLMEVVEKYHACFQEKVKQPDSQPPFAIRQGILLGVGGSQLDYQVSSPFDIPSTDLTNIIHSIATTEYEGKINPSFGFFLDINSPRSLHGFGFRAELFYSPFTFGGNNEYIDPNSQLTIRDEIEIRLQRLALPLGIQKRLGASGSPFYAMLGISPELYVVRRYDLFRENPPGQTIVSPQESIYGRDLFEFGFWSKLGINLTSLDKGSLKLEVKGEYSRSSDRIYEGILGFGASEIAQNVFTVYSLSLMVAYEFDL